MFPGMIGQELAAELLERAVTAGRLPHALLFQGPPGTGKGTFARRLAQALVCEVRPRDGAAPACGRCSACAKVEHRNHPDVFVVERELRKAGRGETSDASTEEGDSAATDAGDAGGGPASSRGAGEVRHFIVVGQIRELCERAAMAPREAPVRVFIIDPADRMNTEAQNALLKTLEEPAGRAVIVLVASRPHLLLPTVRSRCLVVRFAEIPVDDLAEALASRGIPREEALTRAALANGRPGAALSLDLEALRTRRGAWLEALEALSGSERALADLAGFAKQLVGADEEELLLNLEILECLLRDSARSAAGCDGLVYADLAPRLSALGRRLGPARAARLVEAVERVRHDLRLNLNKTLAAEALLASVAGGPVPFA